MPSSGETNTPSASGQHGNTKPEKKHWLEYAIFLFVVATAAATGLAAYYTRNQWCTMQDQLSIMRDTEVRQLRAYILPAGSSIRVDAENIIHISLILKNFGQTPAYDLSGWVCIVIDNYSDNDFKQDAPSRMLPIPSYIDDSIPPKSVLGPGSTRTKTLYTFCDTSLPTPMRPLTAPEFNGLKNSTKAIYLYGTAIYKDAFGIGRWDKYRIFSNSLIGLSDGATADARDGNEAN